MNQWLNIHDIITIMLKLGFMATLAAAGWQDYKSLSIDMRIFIAAGAGGALLQGMQMTAQARLMSGLPGAGWVWKAISHQLTDIGMAVVPGLFLLFLAAVTGEAVGKGDGYFFVVSGLYLGFARNILLLCGSFLMCFLVCLIIWVKGLRHSNNTGKTRIPFLPFAIPAGIGVMII